MSKNLITIAWNESMRAAYDKMQRHRLRHLPVLNDTSEIVGMISDRDVQRAMNSKVKHTGKIFSTTENIEFDPEATVRDYMGWPVMIVDRNTDLRVVAERMLKEKVSSFLVQSGGKTVGIITTDDLLKVLIDLLKDPKSPAARWTLENMIDDGAYGFA